MADNMVEVIIASAAPRADGGFLIKGARVEMPRHEADELKALGIVRDVMPSDAKPATGTYSRRDMRAKG